VFHVISIYEEYVTFNENLLFIFEDYFIIDACHSLNIIHEKLEILDIKNTLQLTMMCLP